MNVYKILALNCGSATVKYQLFATGPELMARNEERVLARGGVDRIGKTDATVTIETNGEKRRARREAPDHRRAVELVLESLADTGNGVLKDVSEIDGVGHRIVHGGEYYSESVLIDEEVERRIEECMELAPLHNPHHLSGYRAARAALPGKPNVAVFDTAFHHTVPRHAYLFGLPYDLYERYKIRRYGFHGTSYRYVSQRFSEVSGKRLEELRLVICHLGSGSSACAVAGGKSVEMSMGFTPLDGLMMGTRAGLLDPGVLLHLMSARDYSVERISEMLHHESGLLGVSGISNDMRTLVREAAGGNERAQLAIDVFCYRVKKFIGTFYAVLNGADALIFTGGIGENQPVVRAACCASLEALGIELDEERNKAVKGEEGRISRDGIATEVWVMPTNEELLIAQETVGLIAGTERARARGRNI